MIPSAGSDKRPREACTDEACTIPRKNPRLASPVDSDNPQQVPAAAPASPRPGSASAAPFLVGCSPLGYVVDPPLSLMQKHVAEGMPLLFRGVQPKQWCRVEERHLRAVAAKEVDLACSKTRDFRGDRRNSVTMKLPLRCLFPDASPAPPFEVYLCQCPVVVPSSKPETSAALPELATHLSPPSPIVAAGVPWEANVWYSPSVRRTNLHYDSYQNFLCVASGVKTVFLFAPDQGGYLYREALYSQSANHCKVDAFRPDFEKHPRFKHARGLRAEVQPGDALFIPEGWFHAVHSSPGTLAVNFWFGGLRPQLTTQRPRTQWYYARVVMETLLAQECEAAREAGSDVALGILADMPEGVRESVVAGLRGDDIDAASLLSAATAACALEVPLSLHERVIVTLVSSDGDAKSEESSGVLGAAVACRSQAACHALLRLMPLIVMVRVVGCVARASEHTWASILRGLDSRTADIWTSVMEKEDSRRGSSEWMQPFYDVVFAGVDAVWAREHLLSLKEQCAREQLEDMLVAGFLR